ncbi:MAG TPA: hypothetical protein VF349_00025 [Candidatus Limnocylindrales bacterium]
MELDAGPKLEGVGQPIWADRGQVEGENGNDLADRARLQAYQAFDYLGLDQHGAIVADEGGIRVDHIAAEPDREGATGLGN